MKDFDQAGKGKSWADLDLEGWAWADQTEGTGLTWQDMRELPAQGLMWLNIEFHGRTWEEWAAVEEKNRQWMQKHPMVYTVSDGPGEDVPAPDQGLTWSNLPESRTIKYTKSIDTATGKPKYFGSATDGKDVSISHSTRLLRSDCKINHAENYAYYIGYHLVSTMSKSHRSTKTRTRYNWGINDHEFMTVSSGSGQEFFNTILQTYPLKSREDMMLFDERILNRVDYSYVAEGLSFSQATVNRRVGNKKVAEVHSFNTDSLLMRKLIKHDNSGFYLETLGYGTSKTAKDYKLPTSKKCSYVNPVKATKDPSYEHMYTNHSYTYSDDFKGNAVKTRTWNTLYDQTVDTTYGTNNLITERKTHVNENGVEYYLEKNEPTSDGRNISNRRVYEKKSGNTSATLKERTGYSYDTKGNLTKELKYYGSNPVSKTDRSGRITRYEYDLAGRLSSEESPDGTTTRYEYDRIGNRSRMTVRNTRTGRQESVTTYT